MMLVSNPNSRTAPLTRWHAACMEFRIPNDATLAYLPFPDLELRFDQYNHLPGRL